ncbi:hypothetical protein [uncultured Haemophilus sp.]|nr:hypothetical protein [uncultured Haemophilus sp.]
MNDPTLSSNVKIKNQLELWLFCAIIGAVFERNTGFLAFVL